MNRRVSVCFAILCLLSMMFLMGLALTVRPVKADYTWTETIYIRADGSVDPDTAPISTVDSITYTLTDNIVGDVPDVSDAIVVERDNIVVDGAGYRVQGTDRGPTGIYLEERTNVILKNVEVTNFVLGIRLVRSSNIALVNNTVSSINSRGIFLSFCSNIALVGNTASRNHIGITISSSSNHIITGNTVIDNNIGIHLYESNSSLLFHNNFTNNTDQVLQVGSQDSIWQDGYPSGGNYWSDYDGSDVYRGVYQDVTGSDGIGDTPYEIDENNTDHSPLMGMFSDFDATVEHQVQTICNSSISDFQYNGTAISFNVTGEDGTNGFCRMCIPTALMSDYQVFLNGTEISYDLLPPPISNSTHDYIYFTYHHSTQEVIIIPEFPSIVILPLFMTVVLLAAAAHRRKRFT